VICYRLECVFLRHVTGATLRISVSHAPVEVTQLLQQGLDQSLLAHARCDVEDWLRTVTPPPRIGPTITRRIEWFSAQRAFVQGQRTKSANADMQTWEQYFACRTVHTNRALSRLLHSICLCCQRFLQGLLSGQHFLQGLLNNVELRDDVE
jgi:hypothetical protein